MPRHPLIETYLHGLHVLPANVVAELTDGLTETYDHHRTLGSEPEQAARAAIEEFGTAEQILTAFDQIALGRRVSRRLLATGPLVGLCWATALIAGRAWRWPVPSWVPLTLAGALVTVTALLLVGAGGRHLHRAAPLGASGLVLLDTIALSGVLAVAPAMSWPLRLALLASLVRVCITARTLPALRTY